MPAKKPNIAGRIALGVGGVILLAYGATQIMGGGDNGNIITTSSEGGFAGELVDRGVSPTRELVSSAAGATPLTIAVGERVSTVELQQLLASNPQVVLVDVQSQPHPQTLQGAVWLPSGGSGGSFQDSYQGDFAAGLSQATGGERSRPLVFFCDSPNCWESHNATLRANAAGYTRLFWYRGGLAAWAEARLPMAALPGQGGGQQTPPPVQPASAQGEERQVESLQPKPDQGGVSPSTVTDSKPPLD